jgi:hypothetical protein
MPLTFILPSNLKMFIGRIPAIDFKKTDFPVPVGPIITEAVPDSIAKEVFLKVVLSLK